MLPVYIMLILFFLKDKDSGIGVIEQLITAEKDPPIHCISVEVEGGGSDGWESFSHHSLVEQGLRGSQA